jgi:hypothetical protein
MLGRDVTLGRIIYGDDYVTLECEGLIAEKGGGKTER